MDRSCTRLFFLCFLLSVSSFAAAQNFNVRDYGGIGDGKAKETAAIQKAVDACTAAGGGTVIVPAGKWISGSIYLKNNVDFYIQAGALILGSPDKEDYNAVDVCPQNYASIKESTAGAHLFLAIEQSNITLRGPGKIDGNGLIFTCDKNGKPYRTKPYQPFPWRPAQMLYFVESQNIRIQDLQLVNAPYWTCFLHGCNHVFIRGLDIRNNRRPLVWEGDGIDIDSSQYVVVSDCMIDVDDDAITLRANPKRLKKKQDCKYITVSNCILSGGCDGIRIGVGDGHISNAVFSNLIIMNGHRAIDFIGAWNSESRGPDIDHIRFQNVYVNTRDLLSIRLGFGKEPKTCKFSDISFDGFFGEVQKGIVLLGQPENPITRISISNFSFKTGIPKSFLQSAHAKDLEVKNVKPSTVSP
ncbi:MAG: glycosyl hydrolase family 28 protein [Planctomycetia bacterium]|nr:glycosyl hydrolase family 28 protein [Planctomycetia bacterium]